MLQTLLERYALSRFLPAPNTHGPRPKFYTGIALFVFALLTAFEISQFVLASDWNSLAFIVIGVAGLAFAIRILNNWRHGLYIFFGWLFFEGFARKLLGNNMAIYFAKDVLVIPRPPVCFTVFLALNFLSICPFDVLGLRAH